MTRVASLALVWSLLYSATLSSQRLAEGPLLLAPRAPAAQIDRSDDWAAIKQLQPGTQVIVLSSQQKTIKGKITTAGDDALEIERRGRPQTVPRDEVIEVRVDHRLSVAGHLGLGLLVGGAVGNLAGRAAACSPQLCGGEGGLAIAGGTVQGMVFGGIGGFVFGQAIHARPGRLVYRRGKP